MEITKHLNIQLLENLITLIIFTLYIWYFSLHTVIEYKGNLKMLIDLIQVMTLDIYKAIVKASEQGNLWGLKRTDY